MKVKIIGAGSIGNHHAKAARTMGWDVDVVDSNFDALTRMRYEIYPQRYGKWDEKIRLFHSPLQLKDGYDIIMIDTPPDVRMNLAIEALKEKPELLHLEKPLCPPSMKDIGEFIIKLKGEHPECMVTVGYNHVVSKGMEKVVEILLSGAIGEIITIDVEFREHWEGIFKAHPWLTGPEVSYLGDWRRGGGASGEHSHALHLWLYLAKIANLGMVAEAKSEFDMIEEKYDRVAAFILKTSRGNIGRVVQDVVTKPPRKWARVQGENGFVEWEYNKYIRDRYFLDSTKENYGYVVTKGFLSENGVLGNIQLQFPKTRQDDFLSLMQHYNDLISGKASYKDSPLHVDSGIRVMDILHDAYYG